MSFLTKEEKDALKKEGKCIICRKPVEDTKYVRCVECRKKIGAHRREAYAFFQSIGICPRCKKNSLYNGEKTCVECKAKSAEYSMGWNEMVKERLSSDPVFREAYLARRRENYRKNAENNKCRRCGKKAQVGKAMCSRCRAIVNEKARVRYGGHCE